MGRGRRSAANLRGEVLEVERPWPCVLSPQKKKVNLYPGSPNQHLQRGAKWFRFRVSIHHPLGFNWHPFEGAGRLFFVWFFRKDYCFSRDLQSTIQGDYSFYGLWLPGYSLQLTVQVPAVCVVLVTPTAVDGWNPRKSGEVASVHQTTFQWEVMFGPNSASNAIRTKDIYILYPGSQPPFWNGASFGMINPCSKNCGL